MNSNIEFSISKKFVAGVLACCAIKSLQQDYWGRDETIRQAASGLKDWLGGPARTEGDLVMNIDELKELERKHGSGWRFQDNTEDKSVSGEVQFLNSFLNLRKELLDLWEACEKHDILLPLPVLAKLGFLQNAARSA